MPPSSAPTPIGTNSTSASTPRRRQPPTTTTGALDIGDDDEEAHADDGSAARRRKRVKGQIVTDVPMVKDAVGESVALSFETFLKTLIPTFTLLAPRAKPDRLGLPKISTSLLHQDQTALLIPQTSLWSILNRSTQCESISLPPSTWTTATFYTRTKFFPTRYRNNIIVSSRTYVGRSTTSSQNTSLRT